MKSWYCVHIKPKKEDSVCQLLKDLPAVELFNPKIHRQKYLRSKPCTVEENLFPCYVFIKFDASQYAQTVRYTRGVRRMVGDHTGHPWTVDESIIDFIRSCAGKEFTELQSQAFQSGDVVRITEGPLAGLQGIFLEEKNVTERVILLLNSIASQAKVDIDKRLISKS
jgi:transcriptional antiterminator RfaH